LKQPLFIKLNKIFVLSKVQINSKLRDIGSENVYGILNSSLCLYESENFVNIGRFNNINNQLAATITVY